MLSKAEQNHLKSIYKLAGSEKESVATNDLAFHLGTRAASVTSMIKKLSGKKLVSYERYYGVRLTEKGEKLAIDVVRKHRLWEVFLNKILGYSWQEVHEIAEELEHVGDDEMINRLEKFLGFPKQDPHGDPIPGKNGKFGSRVPMALHRIQNTGYFIISGFESNNKNFLNKMKNFGISPGTKVKINSIAKNEDEFTEINSAKKNIIITYEISKKIFALPV